MLRNNISLRKHFCKIIGVPIKIYESPYFESRLRLFKQEALFERFVEMVEREYDGNYENFNADYIRVQNEMIDTIKNSEGYNHFNSEDMNKYTVSSELRELPSKDIYKDCYKDRYFISLNMKKANFTSLKHYDQNIFGPNVTKYEDFVDTFSKNYFFKISKHMRQVIFGNCNPKRQATYEKYLMSLVLQDILDDGILKKEDVMCLLTDEIVFDVTNLDRKMVWDELNFLLTKISENKKIDVVPAFFILKKVEGCKGFIKDFCTFPKKYEIKCVDSVDYPFVLRALNNEPYAEEDYVYMHENRMVKLISTPNIKI